MTNHNSDNEKNPDAVQTTSNVRVAADTSLNADSKTFNERTKPATSQYEVDNHPTWISNTENYDQISASFEWEHAWEMLDGNSNRINLGHEIIGPHSENSSRAVRVADFNTGAVEEISYNRLSDLSHQFANCLKDLGLSPGDRVAAMMEPRSELYATLIGTWLGGYVYVPLYTLFGSDGVNYRLNDSGSQVIVTTPEHREKIDEKKLEDLEYIITVNDRSASFSYEEVASYDTSCNPVYIDSRETCKISYTSGTTGDPKGVEVISESLVHYLSYRRYAADLHPDDTYFGVAPPAWKYGIMAATACPLHLGIGLNTSRGQFDPEQFIDIVERWDITSLFAPPTVFRQVANSELDLESRQFTIRNLYSGGEPLDAETVAWSKQVFGEKIHDHYGMTEGGMLCNNYCGIDHWELKPGSMGKPLPGLEVSALDLEDDEPVEPGKTGELAVRQNAPLFAKGYWNLPKKTEEKFGGDWLRTDDLVRIDEDGYFWYEGRADDVIISAGYRIGPTEIEGKLMEHTAVEQAAVTGVPDEERGEIVAAFLKLKDGVEPSDELAEEIQTQVKDELARHEYPREIHFGDLPMTASGKIQRYKLES